MFGSDIQECEIEHDCLNGAICDDGIGTYTCNCATGYTGSFCEISLYNILNIRNRGKSPITDPPY